MKTFRIYSLGLIFFLFLFAACDEVPVEINRPDVVDPIDPDLDNQLQNVLIEEYTGVRCINCPAGSELIEQLIGIHGERLVAVAVHGGRFANPYPSSGEDLKIEDGEKLIDELLGPPQGYPAAVVNRREHPESFGLELVKDDWPGVINVQKELTPKVAIKLTTVYDMPTRRLGIKTEILTKENLNAQDVRLTLLITESKLIDTQLTPDDVTFPPDGIDENYEHNHVLRGFVTPFRGDAIADELVLNQVIERATSFDLPQNWNAANLEVVGIVHLNDDTIEVLQVTSSKVAN